MVYGKYHIKDFQTVVESHNLPNALVFVRMKRAWWELVVPYTKKPTIPALFERVLLNAPLGDKTVLDDLNFLATWDQQALPLLSSALRMRQLRRANPGDDHQDP